MQEELKIKPTITLCRSSEVPDTCSFPMEQANGIHSKVVVVGHVDHGKSTLLGRWLMDAGRVAADQITKVESICAQKGISFEPAFLLDAFEEEQIQGISIDSTRAQVEFEGRKYLFIDVPGHHEFIKNMTSGASDADLGILMIDAAEGIQAQTRGHLQILSILNVPRVIVAVNKMDKFGYDEQTFNKQKDLAQELLQSFGFKNCGIVPVSAINGENIAQPSSKMPWYSGPCLLESVSAASQSAAAGINHSFRMVLQDVYKFEDQRYFVGRVVSGQLTPGRSVLFSPSGKTSKVRSIARYPDMARPSAATGESIAITLTEQIFVERGEIISFPEHAPEVGATVDATIVWLSQEPLHNDATYLLKVGTAESNCTVTVRQPELSSECPVLNGTVVDVVINTSQPVAFERTGTIGNLNRFVLCTEHGTVAAGVIKLDQQSHVLKRAGDQQVQIETGYIERSEREQQQGHKAAVLWLTGLSGAGKSTLAKAMERELFDRNLRVIVLDADTLRSGLCVDLGFTVTDRAENIRRIAETAKVCMSTGAIVIVACISPYRKDRELARQIIGREYFKEIFLSCSLEVCQARDPKGLYKRVSQGTIRSFSGLDSPYQAPLNPSLLLDSAQMSVEESVSSVYNLLLDEAIIE